MKGTNSLAVCDDTQAAPAAAPMLPIEGHIVAAVRALEAAKNNSEAALLTLQWAPRSNADVFHLLNELQACVTNARNAYAIYVELLNCKGQA
jgi:hypothetical protein